MKKNLLSLGIIALSAITVNAQISQTVSMGAGYANNKWYSLANGETATQAANNWDIALAATANPSSPLIASALVNPKTGNLYVATGVTVAKFDTLSTFNSSWTPLYNSMTSWAEGAFNEASLGGMDYGYGTYNTTNHSIEADKVFVIKYSNNTYKKLYITLNTVAGTYSLRHANLDNTDDHTETITISTYNTKNFLYFSLTTNAAIDREPASANWDLEFVQYYEPGSGNPSPVTGVLHNQGVKVAEVSGVNEASYENFSTHTFSADINVIGRDWKTFTGTSYSVTTGLVYFVQDKPGNIWKVVFTGFTSSTGDFVFTKKQLDAVGLVDEKGNVVSKVAVYPNPANGTNVSLVFSTEKNISNASVSIFDLTGKLISNEGIEISAGLNQHTLNTNSLNAGVYFIRLSAGGANTTQKLIIQ